MDINIIYCLDNIQVNYDLNKDYINELFLLIRTMLKPFHKKYELKKRNIIKEIYEYFINKMNVNKSVIRISKLKQPIQRSQEWYDARYNKITASELASVIGTDMSNICENEKKKIFKKPAFKNSYELMKTKILKNDEFKGNIYTDWGILFEPIATLIYEHRNNNHILEFGLIEHPQIDLFAASPDGITQINAIMIEIKVPYQRKLSGLVPLNYWMQMQLQMETCNLDKCHFVEVKTLKYSKEEYDMDNYNETDLLNSGEQMEKGIIIECINNENKKIYYYPSFEVFRSKKKMNDWVEEKVEYYKKIYNIVELIYWKTTEYSCIEVNRDKNWFENILPKCKEFWEKVMYFKNNKDEFIRLDNIKEEEKMKKRKKQTKEEYDKMNVLSLFDSDSDEDIIKLPVNNEILLVNNEIDEKNYESSDNESIKLSIKDRDLADSIENDLDIFIEKPN